MATKVVNDEESGSGSSFSSSFAGKGQHIWEIDHFKHLMRSANKVTAFKILALSNYFDINRRDGRKASFRMVMIINSDNSEEPNDKTIVGVFLYQFEGSPYLNISFTFTIMDKDGNEIKCVTVNHHIFKKEVDGFGFPDLLSGLPNNILELNAIKIICDVTIYYNVSKLITTKVVKKELERKYIGDLLEEQRVEGIKTDITLICEEEEIPCYSNVLMAQSDVLTRMLQTDMTEKRTKVIHIEDMTVDLCQAFVTFLHSDILDESQLSGLLYAAEKYNVESLKLACEEAFMCCIEEDTVLTIVGLADTFSAQNLKTTCLGWIRDNKQISLKSTLQFKKIKATNPGLALEILEANL